jgi:hypothetical protein
MTLTPRICRPSNPWLSSPFLYRLAFRLLRRLALPTSPPTPSSS